MAKSKTQRITEMLSKGKTVKQIVIAVNVSPQMVYTVRSRLRKQKPIEPKPPLSAEGIAGLRPNKHNVVQPAPPEPTVSFWRKLWNMFK